MAIDYSMLDTIQNYDTLFEKFHNDDQSYGLLDRNSKLIYLAAGLGLSNSIHERFIKSVIEEYGRINTLSNTKKDIAIRKYKTPSKLTDFVNLLNLNLNEAFELMKINIQEKFQLINSVDSLMSILRDQRHNRNDYLHGDFNFHEEIVFEVFKENIIDFQEIHSFVLKITRYSFISNIANLPDISNEL